MSCEHDCPGAPEFPRRIHNRPGLERIAYRIGDYDAMCAHMRALLDAAPELAAWTHRGADDPGIALVEAAAVVGDILALYQEAYANEAYLRTARWRESVAELVRVLGYRLAPGLGGRARFALAVRGERPVRIPAGFGITAKLPGADKPAVFETGADFDAVPALSKFHLYRPRQVPSIVNGMDTFQVEGAMELAKGDRLLVGTGEAGVLLHTQVLVVDEVWSAFGVRHVKTRAPLASLRGAGLRVSGGVFSEVSRAGTAAIGRAVSSTAVHAFSAAAAGTGFSALSGTLSGAAAGTVLGSSALQPVFGLDGFATGFFERVLGAGLGVALIGSSPSLRAFKLAATARHFGHNAPARQVVVDALGRVSEAEVSFARRLDRTQGGPAVPALRREQLPLDGEAAEFIAGGTVLVELNLSTAQEGAPARKRVLERAVAQVDRQSLAWGGMAGASTVLEFDDDLALDEPEGRLSWADVRGITVHAVAGQALTLRAPAQPVPTPRGRELDFFGRREDAAALARRALLLALPEGPLVAGVQAVDLSGAAAGERFFRLALDREVALALFDHEAPGVDVYGNLVPATEGRTEAEAVLGHGDARAAFQTFALPKAPLTYLLDTALVPPQQPELQVWVAGVRWQRVDSFFGRGPREAVYVVREDAEGRSFVQFGDGRTGARLPSGLGNVVARWRTGHGAHGLAVEPPGAARRVAGFEAVWMLEPATGGAPPESAARAREAAPGAMQSLGRIVSLADLEAEALALPGVLKARAAWSLPDGAPRVALTVLVASQDPAEAAAIDLALRRALAARGPARWPLQVLVGQRRAVRLSLVLAIDPARRPEDVSEALQAALGVEDDEPADDVDLGEHGLLHWRRRNFGDPLHGSQVIAAAQNVPGVRWVRLERMELAPAGAGAGLALRRPLGASPAATPPSRRTLQVSAQQMLSLARADLALRFEDDGSAP
ncbi:hypothetical protein [Azohydromonas caseinilytica]|uniref:Baseplate assembly protein n=1 Tax=Azohydromonas caseinilytica TaxID=2728836 RepID=A0A848FEY9_9BURK|nr:hypothetical protein [Azohydromonas caseinilytica]NML16833.1 hypothetical protein [Azohydromonas caseinilytica]